MSPINLHATALVIGQTGILITGDSGAGKSSLAMTLIDLCRVRSRFAALVADDRVWLSEASGRLLAQVPETIAGLVEVRGFGPAPAACEHRAVIDRFVVLVDPNEAPRVQLEDSESLLGIKLPRLTLAARDSAGSARAILAWTGLED